MIIVTGGAGFIGSNLVKSLNDSGRDDIIVVDNLTDGTKFKNIADCRIADYLDKYAFLDMIKARSFKEDVDVVFHLGACSATTEWDGRYMMDINFEYSKQMFHFCIEKQIPFIYASSAAVYGDSQVFKEHPDHELPLNVYGYSKLLFDQYVRRHHDQIQSQVAGLRYFNVYGPRESHKGSMASVAYHLNEQLEENGVVKLFAGCDGYADGDQRRDFIYVGDTVKVKLWLMDNPDKSGTFNVGTGRAQPFNDVAKSVLAWHKTGTLEYIPFPEHLKGRYQSYTQADIGNLRDAGYPHEFKTVEEGTSAYLDWLHA